MKTSEDSYREQKKLHPYLPVTPTEAVITMIVPGRRALGETWSKVTIGHDDRDMVVDREDAEAPVGGRPVVAMSGPDAEYTNEILASLAEKAAGRQLSEMSYAEKYRIANEAWMNFVEQKLKHLKGQSTFGAGVTVQRQRVVQNPETRPVMHKER